MVTFKAFSLLAISAVFFSISSPAIAGFSPGYGNTECEFIRRNINSRLPKGINLNRSVVRDVVINGHSSRECIVYGNATAIEYTWNDYRRTIPNQGLELPNGTYTLDGRTYPESLYYGWNESYIPLENGNAIIILTDSASARH
jgi:hypothetical protein